MIDHLQSSAPVETTDNQPKEYAEAFKDTRIGQCLSLLAPADRGPLAQCDRVRISHLPIIDRQEFPDLDPDFDRLITDKVGRVELAKSYLTALMFEEGFLSLLAGSKVDTPITTQQLTGMLGLKEGYGWEMVRLTTILNQAIDPELWPVAFLDYQQRHQLPIALTDALSTDGRLLSRFNQFFSEPESNLFLQNIGTSPESPQISQAKELINYWLTLANLDPATQERARNQLEKFFNLNLSTHYNSNDGASETVSRAMGLTCNTYFIHRETKSDHMGNNSVIWKPKDVSELPREFLRQRARSFEVAKYLVDTNSKVNQFLKDFFPDFFYSHPETRLAYTVPSGEATLELIKDLKAHDEANGSFHPHNKLITLKSGTQIQATSETQIAREPTTEFGNIKHKIKPLILSRQVKDIITLIHEKAHGWFNHAVDNDRRQHPVDYENSAAHAVNEGLAVLIELLSNDLLTKNPQILGLSPVQAGELRAQRSYRLAALKREQTGYTEGIFRILYRIYAKQAYDEQGVENRQEGLLAVKDFISLLDPQKLSAVKRVLADGELPDATNQYEAYQEALKSGNREQWLKLLGKESPTK